jgi:isoprenylcysteine carboxyl methyltransferase (ICMT) family protein YpbQ
MSELKWLHIAYSSLLLIIICELDYFHYKLHANYTFIILLGCYVDYLIWQSAYSTACLTLLLVGCMLLFYRNAREDVEMREFYSNKWADYVVQSAPYKKAQ